jgi:hypothetical protein
MKCVDGLKTGPTRRPRLESKSRSLTGGVGGRLVHAIPDTETETEALPLAVEGPPATAPPEFRPIQARNSQNNLSKLN